jgi:hypothetical protein
MTSAYQSLKARVLHDLDIYDITPNPGATGSPLPPRWFEPRLAKMRASLVEPYAITAIDDSNGGHREVELTVVADDRDGKLIAFDPVEGDGDFVLVVQKDDRLIRANWMRGDVVGCFLSR